ncbi:MAG: polyribonucleotide nucleotidyltransferase, partial [Bdellovibrionaceae bacterium]|nr:polyribonucleotide nucleotidyltransferase [Pseudobdellovibrionaceae bacterium]MDW8190826.1 polyribonucleotide nucleotidyltransferase [Pseudobdellovibrionaceae bacterium]
FLPLTVEFQEKFYASGKIPGGFFKREGKPSTQAVLAARLIDRPIRPLFPDTYRCETQIVATPFSIDGSFPIEILCSLGASAALHISDIPFNGPTAAIQVGRVDGQLIANPTSQQLERSDFDIIVAGTKNGILMVEGEAKFISESDLLAVLRFAHQNIQPLLSAQEELREKTGSKTKREVKPLAIDPDFFQKALDFCYPRVEQAFQLTVKQERHQALADVFAEAENAFVSSAGLSGEEAQLRLKWLKTAFEEVKYKLARKMALQGKRLDGRALNAIRPITCEVGLLPRAHGSGLFTRGETQVLGTVTLGTGDDEQMVDSIFATGTRQFMLHYNFPPYSVGEVGRFGSQGRREIGHGHLAERAIKAVIPPHAEFPYTIRVVGDVLESNGSSSMGTVCAATLALLDAGVPISANVSGIAMGLIKEGDQTVILSDILGDEDHLGDMDFKIAGTAQGITAIQMDIKIDSVSFQIMEQALEQARQGRAQILAEMEKVIRVPRGQLSEFAPRVETLKINPDKIRDLIGPGGKVVRGICEVTGVKIEIENDGRVHVASSDLNAIEQAKKMIYEITAEPEVGKVYRGRVVKIAEFGAFVEILPNSQGLLHISEISHERIRSVNDVFKEGDDVEVKVIDIDRSGRIKLSRKALITKS